MSKLLPILLVLFVLTTAALAFKVIKTDPSCFDQRAQHHQFAIQEAHRLYGFNLLDPEQAPPEIRESVLRGYSIIMNTPFFASKYAKDQLSCTNCHFSGGDSLGGRDNGISLVGVTTKYPTFSKRDNKTITLEDRISNCFQRSMSGHPIPKDAPELKDIINYLTWISKEVQHIKGIPWLGLKFLKSDHKPNKEEGQKIYIKYCAACHKENGEGGGQIQNMENKSIPPIWGPNSFNDGAGMNRVDMLSSFIYYNMPYQDSRLTEEQAIDVAGFVSAQPRPSFKK